MNVTFDCRNGKSSFDTIIVKRARLLPAFLPMLFAADLMAQTACFIGLGDLPGGIVSSQANGISADGRVVVGGSVSDIGEEAFRWTSEEGMVGLGALAIVPSQSQASFAWATSADGAVVVGFTHSANAGETGVEAFQWTQQEGMVGLGDLPGGDFWSRANAVSGDGAISVGSSRTARGGPAAGAWSFLWTALGGMQELDTVGLQDSFVNNAWGVSGDGTVVVGSSESASGSVAFRWSGDTGMVALPALADPGEPFGEAKAVSADGTVIVGASGTSPTRAVKWDASGVAALSASPSEALAVSGYGSVIVGRSDNTAFVWDALHGKRLVQDLATECGADVAGWHFWEANGVSDDGRVVTGWGFNPSGDAEAWLLFLPPPIPAVSVWGLIGLTIVLLVACTVILRRTT